jgi:pimeloyl-ACP methyl ester carboxylesterase
MSPRKNLPDTQEPMHVIRTAEGLRIGADSWGCRGGQLVLLLHGGGQTRHAWRTLGRHLGAQGYFAVAIDLRGHGYSDWAADGDYGQDAFIRDLVDVAASFGAGKPVIVGASLGAGIGLLAAGEGRLTARALVMVDFAPTTERSGFERLRSFMARYGDGFGSLQEVADSIDAFRGTASGARNLAGLAKVVRLDADGRYYWHWDPAQLAWREREFSTRHVRMGAAAQRLEFPMLLVRGEASDVLSEAGARELLELCPQAEYVCVENAGHAIAGDRNDAFGKLIAPFLARVAPVVPLDGA